MGGSARATDGLTISGMLQMIGNIISSFIRADIKALREEKNEICRNSMYGEYQRAF